MTRRRSVLLLVVKATVSATLLALALRLVGSRDVLLRLRDVDLRLALIATCLQFAGLLALAERWRLLALGLLTRVQAVRYTFIGLFYGSVLPGAISGDLAKGAAVAWRDRSTRTAVLPVSILADRLVGLYILILFFGVACLLLAVRPPADSASLARLGAAGVLGSLPLLALGPVLLLKRRRDGGATTAGTAPSPLRRAAGHLFEVADTYRSANGIGRRVVVLSVLIQAFNVAFYVIVLRAFDMSAPLHLVVVLYSVLAVLVMIPVSISGFGIREWFTLAYFPAIGLSADAGVAFALTTVALTWVLALVGVVWQLVDLLPLSSRERSATAPTPAARRSSPPS